MRISVIWISLVLLIALLCSCKDTQKINIDDMSGCTETVDMYFDSYGTESAEGIIDFIRNPKNNQLYKNVHVIFRFVKNNDILRLESISRENDRGQQGEFKTLENETCLNSGEYCSKAIKFLCNDKEIKEQFYKNEIDNIKNIVIIDLSTMEEEVGYVIAAVTDREAYYMTVPLERERYGDYIFQKVYTSDEFLKIYSPRSAKVFVDEKRIELINEPVVGDLVFEMDIFTFLHALGFEYTYEESSKKICFGEYTIQFMEQKNFQADDEYNIVFTSPKDNDSINFLSSTRYKNGTYIGDYYFYNTICFRIGYDMDIHYDDYSVHFNHRQD